MRKVGQVVVVDSESGIRKEQRRGVKEDGIRKLSAFQRRTQMAGEAQEGRTDRPR